MDRHTKQHILNECHSNTIELEILDTMVVEGHITIEEFQQYNLEISKVNELKRRKSSRENTGEEIDSSEDFINSKLNEDFNFGGGFVFDNSHLKQDKKINDSNTANLNNGQNQGGAISTKEAAINDVISKKIKFEELTKCINQNVFDFNDLENAGVNRKLLNSLRYRTSEHRIRLFKKIKDLPQMQEGRTDLYFVGVAKAGKSTMLGGLLHKMFRDGLLLPDTYNSEGTKYQTDLISDIDHGVLPSRTEIGSYNYLAVSIKDKEGNNHPFNIVEVPGENYRRISENGFSSKLENDENGVPKEDFIKPFINYIRNRNKKILIFVIDVYAHENRHEVDLHDALNQSLAYTNILNMFKDNGILENTDAIYLTLNKFDIIRDSHQLGNETEVETASRYLHEEFKSLINNCKEARDRTKNRLKIKILPYSIGDVVYSEILERFEPSYSEILADNLMEDSFVVKGGKFWKKLF